MYSKGVSWINDCRIPFEETQNPATNPKYRLEGNYKMPEKGQISEGSITQFRSSLNEIDVRGRFPSNLLVSDDMLNDGSVTQGTKTKVLEEKTIKYEGWGLNKKKLVEKSDKGTNSRYYDIDKWFDKLINEEGD